MKPKRTVITNYYDCYEVGHIKLCGVGQGTPDHQDTYIIARTLNKDKVLELAKQYGIRLVDPTDDYATGYFVREAECTVDPDTFIDELKPVEDIFMKEAELRVLENKLRELRNRSRTEEDSTKKDYWHTLKSGLLKNQTLLHLLKQQEALEKKIQQTKWELPNR